MLFNYTNYQANRKKYKTDWPSKRVLITDGVSDIGRAAVYEFARKQAKISFLYPSAMRTEAELLLKELRDTFVDLSIHGFPVDFNDIHDEQLLDIMNSAAYEINGIDIFVNTVSMCHPYSIAEVSITKINEMFDLNVKTTMLMLHWACEKMKENMADDSYIGGRVITITSAISFLPEMSFYSAFNASIESCCHGLAGMYKPYNIRVNALAVGLVSEIDTSKSLMHGNEVREEKIKESMFNQQAIPIEQVAKQILNLSSNVSQAITGNTLSIDGGVKIHPIARDIFKDLHSELTVSKVIPKQFETAPIRVLITGGSTGIGRAIVAEFAEEYPTSHIVFTYLTHKNEADLVVAEINEKFPEVKITALPIDLSITEQEKLEFFFDEAVKILGGLDILINNAGVIGVGTFTTQNINKVFNVNAITPMVLSQMAVNYMSRQIKNETIGQSIIFISSLVAQQPARNLIIYSASKACDEQFVKCFAGEVADKGIRVNAIAPGLVVHTEMSKVLDDNPMLMNTVLKQLPLKPGTESREIAQQVITLVSDRFSSTTGSIISTNCGSQVYGSSKNWIEETNWNQNQTSLSMKK